MYFVLITPEKLCHCGDLGVGEPGDGIADRFCNGDCDVPDVYLVDAAGTNGDPGCAGLWLGCML